MYLGHNPAGQPPPELGDQPLVQRARKLMHHRLKVVTADGRTLRGDFQCMDKQQNLVLMGAVECKVTSSGEYEERHMGQVMVPLDQRQSCHVEVPAQQLPYIRSLVEGQREN
mmetsp:Transcript_14301/g.40484  ORF Transcript_14301/g.40484 Transcript_14301/m.40484 type:complete len:112 (-) Transcript_14301:96-431(-)|eukprot:CAMPEP_0117656188 /NCGR_PEP_ID=MMETSP0804-20121206/4673_1 /TAXON_ID=1074897 /ORGANISM="Tetraselmis astigmatica, Strain CCMP880" /LENGTH=111 /DNA_ID=CAMNT_0005462577 /DNA_START=215 /DNA_END=550 /DNA_ORIENTATION=+